MKRDTSTATVDHKHAPATSTKPPAAARPTPTPSASVAVPQTIPNAISKTRLIAEYADDVAKKYPAATTEFISSFTQSALDRCNQCWGRVRWIASAMRECRPWIKTPYIAQDEPWHESVNFNWPRALEELKEVSSVAMQEPRWSTRMTKTQIAGGLGVSIPVLNKMADNREVVIEGVTRESFRILLTDAVKMAFSVNL